MSVVIFIFICEISFTGNIVIPVRRAGADGKSGVGDENMYRRWIYKHIAVVGEFVCYRGVRDENIGRRWIYKGIAVGAAFLSEMQ